jgi:WD40 repeat protein
MSGTVDDATVLWDVQTGSVLRRWSGRNNSVIAMAFSPDGRDVMVGFGDGRVELWRIDTTTDELLLWTTANRYIPELTCEQGKFYQLESPCPAPID